MIRARMFIDGAKVHEGLHDDAWTANQEMLRKVLMHPASRLVVMEFELVPVTPAPN
jgi:hypothetical protein